MQAFTATADQDFDHLEAEIELEQFAGLDTQELIAQALDAGTVPYALVLVLVDRLESYAEEVDSLESALRTAQGLAPRKPGKVVDLHTRRTLA